MKYSWEVEGHYICTDSDGFGLWVEDGRGQLSQVLGTAQFSGGRCEREVKKIVRRFKKELKEWGEYYDKKSGLFFSFSDSWGEDWEGKRWGAEAAVMRHMIRERLAPWVERNQPAEWRLEALAAAVRDVL
jgi:hypothetical protein